MKRTKYILVFLITAGIFLAAFYLSNSINARKVAELRDIQSQISIDILSSETQFDLLTQTSCNTIENSVLSSELALLGTRLDIAEQQLGSKNKEVKELKRHYSLLQIKDYLLMSEMIEKCNLEDRVLILYFYEDDCTDCRKQGVELTRLRNDYNQVRTYSFDYYLEENTIKTLSSIFKVEPTLPALIIDGKVEYGFQEKEALALLLNDMGIEPTQKPEEEVVDEDPSDTETKDKAGE
jgi:thiol-disulfide isomerase/thioredoxin